MFYLRLPLLLFTIVCMAVMNPVFAQEKKATGGFTIKYGDGEQRSNNGDAANESNGITREDSKKLLSPVDTLTGDPQVEDMVRRTFLYDLNVSPVQIPSLFFTIFEQNLLADARKGLVARPPTESEVEESQRRVEEELPPVMGPREISLGGIVYVSSGDWTIWLNNQKVTPDRIPPELVDIRVYKDYVKLKWFDAYTNQIYPVKMRTHQRFNIDTRIFLPG